MKKIIALCLAILTMLSVLSGCGEAKPDPTETTEAKSDPAGTLYVSFGATLELVYDDAGKALQITGTNETGKTLAEAKQDQLNMGCVFVLRAILRYAIDNSLLGDAKTAAVRVGADDPLPADDFLDVIVQDCQYLVDEELAGIDMISLADDKLGEDGNLTCEAAKDLAGKYLKVEAADLSGEQTPVDGVYTFTGGDRSCTVDAFTGLVIGK